MKRCHRLTRGADFARLRKQGRSWAHPLVSLAADRNELACSRFGFIVSKRIGNAVVRNRVKRQLREIMRQRLAEIPAGWDVVLIARPPIAEARFAAMEDAVLQLLQRARLWRPAPEAAVEEPS